MTLEWYVRRLAAMLPAEVAVRVRHAVEAQVWRGWFYARRQSPKLRLRGSPEFRAWGASERAPSHEARTALLAAAEEAVAGRWSVFPSNRCDLASGPDWFVDSRQGVRVAASAYGLAFSWVSADPKFVWELSRHHQTTVLAAAYHLTSDERFARAALEQVRSWVAANPFLQGPHWGSGIELGVRLISWIWTRRLLQAWPFAQAAFEGDAAFRQSVYDHQWLLARRLSAGSSANNHLILELAGLFSAACAFDWFYESRSWRSRAGRLLARELVRQTHPGGFNREMATEYHGFVLEAALAAAVEGDLNDAPLSEGAWEIMRQMFDALADVSDVRGEPTRQGDGDGAHGLLLDAPQYNRWADLHATGGTLRGPRPGRLSTSGGVRAAILHDCLARRAAPPAGGQVSEDGPGSPSAGLYVLASRRAEEDEVFVTFDVGPLGFLSIAAHGHADALSIELRYGGRPILVDPGTYSYHSAPGWRRYFRSTLGHNTLEVGGEDQSFSGGPFLWLRKATARTLAVHGLASGPIAEVVGEHDGYAKRPWHVRHRRTVRLDRDEDLLLVVDELIGKGGGNVRLCFHVHPDIQVSLRGETAGLSWEGGRAEVHLPADLSWRIARGERTPPLGWYSAQYEVLCPTTTLVGYGKGDGTSKWTTRIDLRPS